MVPSVDCCVYVVILVHCLVFPQFSPVVLLIAFWIFAVQSAESCGDYHFFVVLLVYRVIYNTILLNFLPIHGLL